MHYKLIFDASQNAPDWHFAAFGLIFVAAGLVFFLFPLLNKKWTAQKTRLFCCVYIGFALLWTTAVAISTLSQLDQVRSVVERQAYDTVEGTVQNFLPMQAIGRKAESFDVDGTHFAYSNYVITPGFRKTALDHGPIHEGLSVRIGYINTKVTGNEILKLEIADQPPETH